MALFILDFSYCGVNFYAYLEVKADLEMWIHQMGTVLRLVVLLCSFI